MWKKRFLTLFLLSSFFYSYVVASEMQSGLTSIEDYAINIQNNSELQKQQIENLTIDLEESQRLLEESMKQQTAMLQTQEGLLKQLNDYEQKSKNLKIVAGVSISVSIISIGIMCLVLNNK